MPRSIYGATMTAASGGPSTPFSAFASTPLSVGGSNYSPAFAFRGNDAAALTWPASIGGLTLAATSGAPASATVGQATPIEGMLAVTNGDSLTYWSVASAILDLAIGEDLVIETIAVYDTNTRICANETNSNNEGVTARLTGRFVFNVEDSTAASSQAINLASPVDGTWYYSAFVLKRDGSASETFIYDNKNKNGAAAAGTVTGAASGLGNLYVAGTPGAVHQDKVGWVAAYKASDFNTFTTAQFQTAFDARVTLLGQTPGVDIS